MYVPHVNDTTIHKIQLDHFIKYKNISQGNTNITSHKAKANGHQTGYSYRSTRHVYHMTHTYIHHSWARNPVVNIEQTLVLQRTVKVPTIFCSSNIISGERDN